jgi:hypothetical protein
MEDDSGLGVGQMRSFLDRQEDTDVSGIETSALERDGLVTVLRLTTTTCALDLSTHWHVDRLRPRSHTHATLTHVSLTRTSTESTGLAMLDLGQSLLWPAARGCQPSWLAVTGQHTMSTKQNRQQMQVIGRIV